MRERNYGGKRIRRIRAQCEQYDDPDQLPAKLAEWAEYEEFFMHPRFLDMRGDVESWRMWQRAKQEKR